MAKGSGRGLAGGDRRDLPAADTVEHPAQSGLEVAEDAVDPRQDLDGVGRVLALHDALVSDPYLGKAALALKRIGAHRCVLDIDEATQEGIQVVLEGESPKHREAKAPGLEFSMLDGSGHQGLAAESSAPSEPARPRFQPWISDFEASS